LSLVIRKRDKKVITKGAKKRGERLEIGTPTMNEEKEKTEANRRDNNRKRDEKDYFFRETIPDDENVEHG